MRALARSLTTPARGAEAGFSIVEILVAVLLIAVGILASFTVLDSAGRSADAAKRTSAAQTILQSEVEQMRAAGFAGLALSGAPGHTAEGPGQFVSDSVSPARLRIMANYRDPASGPLDEASPDEELVIGGAISPGPETVTAGVTTETVTAGVTSVVVHRFVTWANGDCYAPSSPCAQSDGKDLKRITVAVVPAPTAGSARVPATLWASTLVADPAAGPQGGAGSPQANPGSGAAVSINTWHLTDTSCTYDDRQPLRAVGHVLRDTGLRSAQCSAPSAPDLMVPDGLPEHDGDSPPVPDYSTDLHRDNPHGLEIIRHGSDCSSGYSVLGLNLGDPLSGTLAASVHSWATPPLQHELRTPTTGARTAFTFWTNSVRDVDGVGGKATICLVLRKMSADAVPVVSAPLVSARFTLDSWPTDPTQLSFVADHPPFTPPLAPGERLLATVSVTADADHNIELLYDTHAADSFISVRVAEGEGT